MPGYNSLDFSNKPGLSRCIRKIQWWCCAGVARVRHYDRCPKNSNRHKKTPDFRPGRAGVYLDNTLLFKGLFLAGQFRLVLFPAIHIILMFLPFARFPYHAVEILFKSLEDVRSNLIKSSSLGIY